MKQRRIQIFCVLGSPSEYHVQNSANDLTKNINGWIEKHPECEVEKIEFKPRAAGSKYHNYIYLNAAIHYYITDAKTP